MSDESEDNVDQDEAASCARCRPIMPLAIQIDVALNSDTCARCWPIDVVRRKRNVQRFEEYHCQITPAVKLPVKFKFSLFDSGQIIKSTVLQTSPATPAHQHKFSLRPRRLNSSFVASVVKKLSPSTFSVTTEKTPKSNKKSSSTTPCSSSFKKNNSGLKRKLSPSLTPVDLDPLHKMDLHAFEVQLRRLSGQYVHSEIPLPGFRPFNLDERIKELESSSASIQS